MQCFPFRELGGVVCASKAAALLWRPHAGGLAVAEEAFVWVDVVASPYLEVARLAVDSFLVYSLVVDSIPGISQMICPLGKMMVW
jgi:hypothetical protein